MGTMANSKDPDEMPPYLHCLQNPSSEKEIQYFFETITCCPSLCTMDHPDFSVCSFIENSIGLERVIGSLYRLKMRLPVNRRG